MSSWTTYAWHNRSILNACTNREPIQSIFSIRPSHQHMLGTADEYLTQTQLARPIRRFSCHIQLSDICLAQPNDIQRMYQSRTISIQFSDSAVTSKYARHGRWISNTYNLLIGSLVLTAITSRDKYAWHSQSIFNAHTNCEPSQSISRLCRRIKICLACPINIYRKYSFARPISIFHCSDQPSGICLAQPIDTRYIYQSRANSMHFPLLPTHWNIPDISNEYSMQIQLVYRNQSFSLS